MVTAFVLIKTDAARIPETAEEISAIEGISEAEAKARLRAADRARTAYVRRLYRVDPSDPSLYHLVIDSTAIPLDAVIELILAAVRAHEAATEGATAQA